jgi:hypothetical protein
VKINTKFDTALFVTAMTVLLYTWSAVSFNGFLGIMSLDSDLMERNFHQVIYGGLLISFAPVITIVFATWAILFVWTHGVLPVYVDFVRKEFSRRRKVVEIRRFWFGKRNATHIERRANALFTKVSFGLLAGFMFIISLVYFESIGSSKAKTILENHVQGKNKQSQMIEVKINSITKKLRFLACGARTCAGIEEKTNRIYYFPAANSYSYVHHESALVKLSN